MIMQKVVNMYLFGLVSSDVQQEAIVVCRVKYLTVRRRLKLRYLPPPSNKYKTRHASTKKGLEAP
jgi:hypothetical protein